MKETLLETLLQRECQVHVALRNLGVRAARLAEYILRPVRKVARQLHSAIRQDLDSLIAAERLEIAKIQSESAVRRRRDLADLVAIRVLPIRRQSHDLAFVAVVAVADEFANHGVNAAQRVRKKDAIKNLNFVAFATGHHRRNKVARTVIAESGCFFPG